MRYILILFTFLAFSFGDNVSQSFTVKGMHCGYGCVTKLQTAVNSLEGVNKCDVDFNKSLMVVEFDSEKLNSEKIIASVGENTTYKASKMVEKKENFWSKLKNMFGNKS